ncbi:MAG: metallophosphoesterase [Phycisphaerales bacterium]|nr:MAG: metallophosphoesterase [Phycisphaerales bacterium]
MSNIAQQSLNRRQFLKSAMALAGGVVTLGPTQVLGANRWEPAHWAFLSDTHISANPDNHYRGFYPYQNLQEVTGQLGSGLPDGLVVTGDLARLKGHKGDYWNLQKLLTPIAEQRPVHLATGNHDNRENFLNAFTHSGERDWLVDGKRIVTVKTGQVMLILLDSLLFVDLPWGRLGRSQLAWLRTYLNALDDIPTILCLHHPIKGRGALLDGQRLLNLIRPIAKVKAVVHGHSHEFAFRETDGIHVISLPATGYNQNNAEPVGWVDAHLTGEYGVFTLRAVGGNTRLNNHTEQHRWRT